MGLLFCRRAPGGQWGSHVTQNTYTSQVEVTNLKCLCVVTEIETWLRELCLTKACTAIKSS